jgi:2-polyprenyl-6-methoxyphenol hydroxylase-like FAD-dependent oxidoreductase
MGTSSGTRNALEDAIALARALTDCDSNVPAALRAFEASRRPGVEKFLDVARQSYVWYERFRQKMSLAPLPFAYDYLMRSGRITHDRLRAVSPKFVAAYEADRATDSLADNGGS